MDEQKHRRRKLNSVQKLANQNNSFPLCRYSSTCPQKRSFKDFLFIYFLFSTVNNIGSILLAVSNSCQITFLLISLYRSCNIIFNGDIHSTNMFEKIIGTSQVETSPSPEIFVLTSPLKLANLSLATESIVYHLKIHHRRWVKISSIIWCIT